MISRYKTGGREILMSFTCGRCGKKHIEPYEKQNKQAEGNIQCFLVPEGWLDDGIHNPMMCKECHDDYKRFLENIKEYCCEQNDED